MVLMILIFQCFDMVTLLLIYVSNCYGRVKLNVFASCSAYLYSSLKKSEFSNVMHVPNDPAMDAHKERRKKVRCILNVSST